MKLVQFPLLVLPPKCFWKAGRQAQPPSPRLEPWNVYVGTWTLGARTQQDLMFSSRVFPSEKGSDLNQKFITGENGTGLRFTIVSQGTGEAAVTRRPQKTAALATIVPMVHPVGWESMVHQSQGILIWKVYTALMLTSHWSECGHTATSTAREAGKCSLPGWPHAKINVLRVSRRGHY